MDSVGEWATTSVGIGHGTGIRIAIVCTPEDAFHCFMGTNMEAQAVGNCSLRKSGQDRGLERQYQSKFDLD